MSEPIRESPGLMALVDYLFSVARLTSGTLHDGWRFGSYEHLVWTLGRPYLPRALPPSVLPGVAKKCYANTLDLVLVRPELTYVEGFALHAEAGLAVLHAWAVDAVGRVWDRTWEHPERCSYYGIPFQRAELLRFDALGEDYLGIIASQYLLGNSLLRTGRLFPGEGRPQPRPHPHRA